MQFFDPSFFAASVVLVTMSCISLLISLNFRRKSRAIDDFPKNMNARIFKKTFNVFNPYPEKRTVIHEHLELLLLFAIFGSFVGIGFVFMAIFEFGFLLAFFTLIVCLGFLLIDETLEVQQNTNKILNALKKGIKFGKGDLEVLNFLGRTLPRLSYYHLMIAIIFFAASLTMPYVVNVVVSVFSGLAMLIFAASATLWFFPPFVILCTALMFGATIFTVQFVSNRVKMRIFRFPASERLNVLSEQFYRMKMFIGIQHHHPTLHVPEVSEPEKADQQEFDSAES
jgi:hypothetical protein